VNIFNRTFTRLLMMGVFSRVCSGVLRGMRESAVSDSGREHWFCFWVGGIGNGKRRHHGPWSLSYVHSMSHPQKTVQIYVFMFCVMSYIMYTVSVVVVSLMRLYACVGSVCGGVTSLMCLGRDVHECVR
jgi:hypothetical protein